MEVRPLAVGHERSGRTRNRDNQFVNISELVEIDWSVFDTSSILGHHPKDGVSLGKNNGQVLEWMRGRLENGEAREANWYVTERVLKQLGSENYLSSCIEIEGKRRIEFLEELERDRRVLHPEMLPSDARIQYDEVHEDFEAYLRLNGKLEEADAEITSIGYSLATSGEDVVVATNDFGIVQARNDVVNYMRVRNDKFMTAVHRGGLHFEITECQ